MTLHVITALVERRREIMREMAVMQQELHRCELAVGHIDATILLFEPQFDFGSLKPKKPVTEDEIFRPGEAPVIALEVLKEARKPLSTTDITKGMLAKRGSPRLPFRQFESLNAKVNACLNTKLRQGVLRKRGRTQDGNRSVLWEILH